MKKHLRRISGLLLALLMLLLLPAPTMACFPDDEELHRAVTLSFIDTMPTQTREEKPVTYAEYFNMLDRAVELLEPAQLGYWRAGKLAIPYSTAYVDLTATRQSEATMRRSEGILSLFLAAWTLGPDYLLTPNNYNPMLNNWYGDGAWPDSGSFPNADQLKFSLKGEHGNEGFTVCDSTNYDHLNDPNVWKSDLCAYAYALGRVSTYSGCLLFDYDAGEKTLHAGDTLSYGDAVRSVLRLHDSFLSIETDGGWTSFEELAVIDRAAGLKSEILNSATQIVKVRKTEALKGSNYTGTAYYVSSSTGDDWNAGTTPETAFKSLSRVDCRYNSGNDTYGHDGFLEPGDAVFLKRGDTWRETLYCDVGVTYSAYGEGAKPRILGSPENGADSSKWLLYYSDHNGKKIWQYTENIADCGGMVFNEGERCGTRVFSWFDYAQSSPAADVFVYPYDKTRSFVIKDALTQDLAFYSTFEGMYGKAPDNYQANSRSYYVNNVDSRGPIYLRCDAGNPGKVFESVEFQSKPDLESAKAGYVGLVRCADGCVVDNLCVMYDSVIGICRNFSNNILIQNCEVGYIGGTCFALNYYDSSDTSIPVPTAGEAVRLEGFNNTIKNSYIHDSFDGAVTMEFDYYTDSEETLRASNGRELLSANNAGNIDLNTQQMFLNMQVSGNVIERSGNGIVVGDHNFNNRGEEYSSFKICGDVTISDNYILDSGGGWSGNPDYDTWINLSRNSEYSGHALTFWDSPTYNTGISVSENYFIRPRGSAVRMGMDSLSPYPYFSGNCYLLDAGSPLCAAWLEGRQDVFTFYAIDRRFSESLCVSQLQEENARVLLGLSAPKLTNQDGSSVTMNWSDRGTVADGTLILSMYSAEGKLLLLRCFPLDTEIDDISCNISLPAQTQYVKAFLLSGDYSPLYVSSSQALELIEHLST